MLDVAVIILTYNEEKNIGRCLENVTKFSNEVYIIDSFSDDNTINICKEYKCNVLQHKFLFHANQLNWALSNINFKSSWILRLDADEFVTSSLINEMYDKIPNISQDIGGVLIKRRGVFLDKWIRWGGFYPVWFLRLWRKGAVVFENKVMDEHAILLKGRKIKFKYDFIDDNQNNLTWWVSKQNNYATKEVIEMLNCKFNLFESDSIKANFFGSYEERIRWFKMNIYMNCPLFIRPFLFFIYRVIFRLGFLDGLRGLIWYFLQCFWYRFLVDVKYYQIIRKHKKTSLSIKKIIFEEYNINIDNYGSK